MKVEFFFQTPQRESYIYREKEKKKNYSSDPFYLLSSNNISDLNEALPVYFIPTTSGEVFEKCLSLKL